jgi:hypothetical protein
MSPSVLLQYALPHRLLSRLVMWATRWRCGRGRTADPPDQRNASTSTSGGASTRIPRLPALQCLLHPRAEARRARRRSRPARAADARRRPHQPGSAGSRTGRIFQAKGQPSPPPSCWATSRRRALRRRLVRHRLPVAARLPPRAHALDRRRCARRCTCPAGCSASRPGRSTPSRACSRATSGWSATSRPTSGRWRW